MAKTYSLEGLAALATARQRGRKCVREWDKERNAMGMFLANGWGMKELAHHYKCHPSTIFRQMQRMGLSTPAQAVMKNIKEGGGA
jgi:hypothetical protein